MKAIYSAVLLIIILIITADPINSQQISGENKHFETDITTTRIKPNQIKQIQKDSTFNSMLELLEEEGEIINLNKGDEIRSHNQSETIEYSFGITKRGTNEPGEYSRLIYSERKGKRPFIYFDDQNSYGLKPVQGKVIETKSLFGCIFTPWDYWQVTNTYCDYNFWCFFKRQQALYLTETRQKRCPNGSIKTQTRTVKVHCGC